MTEQKRLVVGTRGSQMALVQTNMVADQLKLRHPGLEIDTKVITTKGDVDNAPIPLDTVGKAWFTKEIEQALLDGEIDFAVHSMKDVPPEIPPGLVVFPVLKRNDPSDALVSKTGKHLADLPQGARVGTDSLRRRAMLLQQRSDLRVESVRGNVNTRLQKLDAGEYDALVLAAAGLDRIDKSDVITEYFDPTLFIPAPGQGALAIETRTENTGMLIEMLRGLQDEPTLAAIAAEQAFVEVIGGGCKLPVACYVRFEDDMAYAYGMVGSMDGLQCKVQAASGAATDATELARQLAAELAKEPYVAEYVDAGHK